MSKLVVRLRERAGAAFHWGYNEDGQAHADAANCIEQLETRLATLEEKARAALDEFYGGRANEQADHDALATYLDAQEADHADA